jgi:aryl-alcohol dehydrogenase-like predicted oxidoreductase
MLDDLHTRRDACRALAALAALSCWPGTRMQAAETRMATRKVPASGEELPVIGMGSSGTFDVGTGAEARAPLREVLKIFVDSGATVIDTSPMYGQSEAVLGDLIAAVGIRPRLWIATKVWTKGAAEGVRQIEDSMRKLRVDRLELLQIHNLVDWQAHVPTLRSMKDAGKLRYTGITHYRSEAHDEAEAVLREELFDFVQINYSIGEREAEDRLLPFCQDKGIGVIVNRPFEDGALFERVRGKPLPPWAPDVGIASWGQFFLRYAASHPAVTCVIPATAKPKHMADNCAAGINPLPDARQRQRMEQYFESL